ncbi:AAA family ATPase [Microbacterium sp. zg.Y909]|uniref:AAA family ATPase n=1 Tax=Microbacterium sp. zg.Y909 TaxID=2969413 RepID=UPI00214CC389|nr:ATP-binding protein [Microbacterium sp. zg.Y909]MCR2824292.1 ATP-binding protein [Microbacterium sp. zg.Y909]
MEFRSAEPTILLAPNRAGKTHILRLTAAALSLDAQTLLETVYDELSIEFSDGYCLTATRRVEDRGPRVSMRALLYGEQAGAGLSIAMEDLDTPQVLPPGIAKVGPGRWVNERTGMQLGAHDLKRRYGVEADALAGRLKEAPQIEQLCGHPRPVFIDTWRLDARADDSRMLGDWGSPRGRSGAAAASRIRGYTEKLSGEITEARRASVQATQSADLSFAQRALEAADRTIKEAELHKRYDDTVERYEALARNGLAVGEAPIPFPERTSPTVRRILSVFLDDWDRRLEPLLPVNEKLQTLRDILDSKLAPSGKRTSISARGALEFHNVSGLRLPVSRLSSGEQHLVALFTLLLFAAKPGSLVLVDEPEISLHAAWKHAFLTDITRVAEVSNLQIVIATHSAGIVNGRWDLTEELVLSTDARLDDADVDSLTDEDFDE